MPGGMGGGMGGLLGGLLGGGGGMGGPGGGMGGMGGPGGGMGGMGRNNQNQQNTQETEDTSDVYDVDRWKRADGMDDGYQELSYDRRTNVQQVRDAWDRDKKEKEGKGLGSRIKNIFSRDKEKENKKKKEEAPPPVNYTVTTPEMKKVQNRSTNPIANAEKAEKEAKAAETSPVAPVVNPVIQQRPEHAFNYLGLTFPSDIDTFFTSNPINSAILATDSLSLGPLTLDQVASTDGFGIPPINLVASSVAPAQPDPPIVEQAAAVAGSPPLAGSTQNIPPSLENKDERQPGPAGARGPARNLITERTGTNLMDSYRDSREQRKYEVKIN